MQKDDDSSYSATSSLLLGLSEIELFMVMVIAESSAVKVSLYPKLFCAVLFKSHLQPLAVL